MTAPGASGTMRSRSMWRRAAIMVLAKAWLRRFSGGLESVRMWIPGEEEGESIVRLANVGAMVKAL